MSLTYVTYGTGNAFPMEDDRCPEDIRVDCNRNEWWWRVCPGYERGPFQIGRTVLVPEGQEDKELYGPMMVIETNNPDHRQNLEAAKRELFGEKVHARQ